MTEHAIAVAALMIAVADMVLSTVALYFLIGIWHDDRAMRIAAEKSLNAQLEYLGLRRKWYDTRTKKKDNEKANVRPVDGTNQNSVQPAESSN
jgi:hypothetical protein